MKVVNSFKDYLGCYFIRDGGLKRDVSIKVGEDMRKFGAMKNMWSCGSESLNVKEL